MCLVYWVEAFAVVDAEGVEDMFPSADLSGEVLPVFPAGGSGEVEHFHRGLVGWEVASVTDRATESGVERLDRVCCVNDVAKLGGELEKRDELGPRAFPRSNHRRVLGLPFRSELFELCFGRRNGRCGVDLAEPTSDLTPMFLRRIPQTIANQMDNTD